jgi:hypothetical protein
VLKGGEDLFANSKNSQQANTQQYRRAQEMLGFSKHIQFRFGNNFKLDFYPLMSSHSSLHCDINKKKILICHYSDKPVLASVGDDEVLRLWNTHNKLQITAKNIGQRATCIDLSFD